MEISKRAKALDFWREGASLDGSGLPFWRGQGVISTIQQRVTQNKKAHKPKFVGFLDESW